MPQSQLACICKRIRKCSYGAPIEGVLTLLSAAALAPSIATSQNHETDCMKGFTTGGTPDKLGLGLQHRALGLKQLWVGHPSPISATTWLSLQPPHSICEHLAVSSSKGYREERWDFCINKVMKPELSKKMRVGGGLSVCNSSACLPSIT